MHGAVKVGITAWGESTLVASGFYPKSARGAEGRLRYYASQFPIVENDMAYYAIPERRLCEEWSARTPDGFTMDVKAFAPLTGHYTDSRRLPPEVRDQLPAAARGRARVYPRHLPLELRGELERRFRESLEPLAERGRLGVVLFQFPVWFPNSRENRRELERIAARFQPYRVAIEFRNATWMDPESRERTLALLADHGLAYTSVDEPQGFVSSVPPIAAATTEVAVVRLHGRLASRWERANQTAAERFAYLYSTAELGEWVPRVRALAERAREVHVLFNNCHDDYSVRNAREFTELLAAEGLGAPAP